VASTLEGIPLVTRGAVDLLANPTLATGDVKISKDGGAFANLTTLPTVTPASGVAVRVELSAAEAEFTRATIAFVDQTAPKAWEDWVVLLHSPKAEGVTCGKITSGSPSTTAFISTQLTGAGTDHYRHAWLTFLTGVNAGAVRRITAFDPATDTVTVEAFPSAPSVGDVFQVITGA
jgi:hypothetical protein